MFPDPCGSILAQATANGADPYSVVPDDYLIVHGGTAPIPPAGSVFSGAAGPTLEAAGCAIPHGQLRVTTAGAIRTGGGYVLWVPDQSRYGTINEQHVNIREGGSTSFSQVQPNPVPRRQRIDGNHP